MRHKYDTRALVLARSPLGEAHAYLTLLTPELGLVRARAEGVRRQGAKLAHALATLAESDVVLVRGKETWRVAGAVLADSWFVRLASPEARRRAARTTGLLLRLVAGESPEARLYPLMRQYLEALAGQPEEAHESLEMLAALHLLAALGLDASSSAVSDFFTPAALAEAGTARREYITRINRGIEASGL